MKELTNIQARLVAPKNQYNTFGKYKYRSAEDILNALKPLLKDNDCSLTISDDIALIGNRFYVKATATLKNATGEVESVSAYAREEETKKGMDGSQVTGTASSYARKYALNGLFCIDDTKDADYLNNGENGSNGASNAARTTTLAEAIADVYAAKSRDELVQVWKNNTAFQSVEDFKKAFHASPFSEKK